MKKRIDNELSKFFDSDTIKALHKKVDSLPCDFEEKLNEKLDAIIHAITSVVCNKRMNVENRKFVLRNDVKVEWHRIYSELIGINRPGEKAFQRGMIVRSIIMLETSNTLLTELSKHPVSKWPSLDWDSPNGKRNGKKIFKAEHALSADNLYAFVNLIIDENPSFEDYDSVFNRIKEYFSYSKIWMLHSFESDLLDGGPDCILKFEDNGPSYTGLNIKTNEDPELRINKLNEVFGTVLI